MKVSAIQIVQFGFPLLSSLNVGGQTLRRLEIYAPNEKPTVEIDVAVNVSRTFKKPPWGPWIKNLSPFASNSEDVIIFGNS
jgi:hypothetical protein